MDSRRAGGRVLQFLEQLSQCLREGDKRLKARLTSWLINQRRSGDKCPKINSKTVEQAKQSQDLPVHERADRLLQYFGSQTAELLEKLFGTQTKICSMQR